METWEILLFTSISNEADGIDFYVIKVFVVC